MFDFFFRNQTKKAPRKTTPAVDANESPFMTMKGKDGGYYFSTETDGKFIWKKIKDRVRAKLWERFNTPINLKDIPTPKAKYLIWDNVLQVYTVYDYGKNVDIYFNKYISNKSIYLQKRISNDNQNHGQVIQGMIMKVPYLRLFVGDNALKERGYSKKGQHAGNTLLIEKTKNSYLHVGGDILEFETPDGDVIEKYFSPLGNDGSPYPYAIGQKYTYLLLEEGKVGERQYRPYLSNEHFDHTKDAYLQFYANPEYYYKLFKKLKHKILYKRYQLSYND